MIVVLGAGGLLGSWICAKYPKETIGFTRKEVNVTDSVQLLRLLEDTSPDAVINCTGITKRSMTTVDEMLTVNALVPHRISSICDLLGLKLVQVSTDCVFSGKSGYYSEDSRPDETDLYGTTKYRGEVYYNPHITVRTSFVGWPDSKGHGLLSWLNRQESVNGFENYIWNGVTVYTLADILMELAQNRIHGLMHIEGQHTNKYEVLSLANRVYGWNVNILPVNTVKVNRILITGRKDSPSVEPFDLYDQLVAMKEFERKYLDHLQ